MNIKRVWDTRGLPSGPEFTACGLSLNYVQFSYRNVTGPGSRTRLGAVRNWVKQVGLELCRK